MQYGKRYDLRNPPRRRHSRKHHTNRRKSKIRNRCRKVLRIGLDALRHCAVMPKLPPDDDDGYKYHRWYGAPPGGGLLDYPMPEPKRRPDIPFDVMYPKPQTLTTKEKLMKTIVMTLLLFPFLLSCSLFTGKQNAQALADSIVTKDQIMRQQTDAAVKLMGVLKAKGADDSFVNAYLTFFNANQANHDKLTQGSLELLSEMGTFDWQQVYYTYREIKVAWDKAKNEPTPTPAPLPTPEPAPAQ